jgi:hypothetical protein
MMKYKIDFTLLTCVPLSDVTCWHIIKGILPRDVPLKVFSGTSFPLVSEYPMGAILKFYKNSQLCFYRWCHGIDENPDKGKITDYI